MKELIGIDRRVSKRSTSIVKGFNGTDGYNRANRESISSVKDLIGIDGYRRESTMVGYTNRLKGALGDVMFHYLGMDA